MNGETIVAIVVAIFASTGFWSFLSSRFQRKDKKEDTTDDLMEKDEEMEKRMTSLEGALTGLKDQLDLQSQMLRGIGHDRIISIGESYLQRKYITPEEYENLHDYLYVPYHNLGGNGTAEKVMEEVKKLPMKPTKYPEYGGVCS